MPHDPASAAALRTAEATAFRFRYTSRDYESILQEILDFITQTRPSEQSDFFESNLGIMLVQIAALVGDDLAFGQDITGIEVFLSTCRRLESALRTARSVGYVPRSSTAATVRVDGISIPGIVVTNGATVPEGAVITGEGGVRYELLEDAVIPPGATATSLILTEGTSREDEEDNTNQPGQEIVTTQGVVADESWHVFVGDPTNPANEWTQVEKVALELSPTETYEVAFDGEGKLHVVFGDGSAGKIPDDTLTLRYRTTQGAAGNAPINAVRGVLRVDVGGGFGTASIEYVNSAESAAGGRDRETLAELKVNIPAFIRSLDKILTLSDYDTRLLAVPGVVLVLSDISIASFSRNIVRVHVWDQEDVTFTSESPAALMRSDAAYTRYAIVPHARVSDILAFLRTRTLVTVQNIIVRPDLAFVDFYLGNVRFDPGFDAEDVHQNITDAVVAVFEASTGFAIRISDVYRAIDHAQGVESFNIERVVFEHLALQEATGSIELVLQPLDGDQILLNDGFTNAIFEFDNNASVTSGAIGVTIGTTIRDTLLNLITKINQNMAIDAVEDFGAANPTILLTHRSGGTQFNLAITLSPASASTRITVTGMSGGTDDPLSRLDDHRRIQAPINDPFPVGAYVPGEPFVEAGPAWQDGGQTPYREIEDLVIESARNQLRFYDEEFLFNNEIFFDAGTSVLTAVQAIVLRRLVFELVVAS